MKESTQPSHELEPESVDLPRSPRLVGLDKPQPEEPTEPDEPGYKWIELHGQRVRVLICPPGRAEAPKLPTDLRRDSKAARHDSKARYEQRARRCGVSESAHDGGLSHPVGYGGADEKELVGEVRQTRGSWASGWGQKPDDA